MSHHSGWTTQDELNYLRHLVEWNADLVKNYYTACLQRVKWAGMNRIEILTAIRKQLCPPCA